MFANPEAQSSLEAFFNAIDTYHCLEDLPHGPLFGVTDLSVFEAMLATGGLTNPRFAFQEVIWRTRTLDPVIGAFWDWGNTAALSQDLRDRRAHHGLGFPFEAPILVDSSGRELQSHHPLDT